MPGNKKKNGSSRVPPRRPRFPRTAQPIMGIGGPRGIGGAAALKRLYQ